MTPALAALLLAAAQQTTPVETPAVSAEAAYSDRVTLLAADKACAFFTPAERALLDALAERSRDDLARAGRSDTGLDRIKTEAQADVTCDQQAVRDAAASHRDHASRLAFNGELAFPGLYQDWVSERRQRTTPLWRIHQTDRARIATLGVHPGENGDVLALALRSEIAPAYAVMVIRNVERQAEPLDFTADGLLPAPYDDPLSAWGGAAGAEIRFSAAKRLDGEVAAQLAPASGTPAYAFSFPQRAMDALRTLAPRDAVRFELTDARGEPIQTLFFEAGMFNAALAVQALPAPPPEPTEAAASR